MSIRLAIVGSRSFHNYTRLCQVVDRISKKSKIDCIVSGGAFGADSLAKRYAQKKGITYVEFLPEWRKDGKYDASAGKRRNTDIINAADYVIAFWDGASTGTKDSINKARTAKHHPFVQVERF